MIATGKPRRDIHQEITTNIIDQLSQGVRPWLRPWNAEHAAGRITRPLRHNGEPYRGINILMLWDSAEKQGFLSPFWLTFRQAKSLGGSIRKGEKGSPVVYASSFEKTETDENGDEVEQRIPFLKQYTVFAADQIDGLPAHYYEMKEPPNNDIERIVQAEAFFLATQAEIREGGSKAYYAIDSDHIQMPPLECFRDAESHAATLSHELVHWTRHPSRLDRHLGRKRWGDEGYAMEELVAEVGSAFLCADLAITPEIMSNHAAYLESWLKVLKDDKRAIFTAASLASKAVDYLHTLQPVTTVNDHDLVEIG